MAKCSGCGQDLVPGSRFCSQCGRPVEVKNSETGVDNSSSTAVGEPHVETAGLNDVQPKKSKAAEMPFVDLGSGLNYVMGYAFAVVTTILAVFWYKTKPITSKQLLVGSGAFLLSLIVMPFLRDEEIWLVGVVLLVGGIYLLSRAVKKINAERKRLIGQTAKNYDMTERQVVEQADKDVLPGKQRQRLIFGFGFLVVAPIAFMIPVVIGTIGSALGYSFLVMLTLGLAALDTEQSMEPPVEVYILGGVLAVACLVASVYNFVRYFQARKTIEAGVKPKDAEEKTIK